MHNDIPSQYKHPQLYDLLVTFPGDKRPLVVTSETPWEAVTDFVSKIPNMPKPETGGKFVPDSPETDLPYIWQFIQGHSLTAIGYSALLGLKENRFLMFKKRPFSNYLLNSIMNLDSYLAIVFTYPLYLIARSIVWPIQTLRRRET